MSIVNSVFNAVLGGFLSLFSSLPPWVGLLVISLLTSIVALYVYKYASNQGAISRVKDQIQGGIYEIRLFNDDVRAVLRAQSEILWHNLKYLGLNLVPVAVMIVPIVFIAAQLQAEYGYEGLAPGQPVLVTVELQENWAESVPSNQGKPAVELVAPDGIRVETYPVWVDESRELTWRIAAERSGDYDLVVRAGDTDYPKRVSASPEAARRSPVRQAPNFLGQLLYPAEDVLPSDGAVRAIHIAYEDATVGIAGLHLHWIIWFMILTMVLAFLLRDRMGVTF